MRVPHPRCARNGRPEPPQPQACTKCRCPATSPRPDRRARLPHDSGAIGHCAAPRSAENEGPVKREALELDTSTPYVERAIRPPTRRNSLQFDSQVASLGSNRNQRTHRTTHGHRFIIAIGRDHRLPGGANWSDATALRADDDHWPACRKTRGWVWLVRREVNRGIPRTSRSVSLCSQSRQRLIPR